MKRPILLLLLLVFLAAALVSCNTKAPAPTEGETTAAGTASGEPAATDADRWEALAPKVTIMAERLRNLRFEISTFGNAEKSSKNKPYIVGPDEIVDGVTPVIEQRVYRRNRAAGELLKINVEYVFWDDLAWAKQAGRITDLVQAKAVDAPDLFVNGMYDLNKALLTVGAFRDIRSIRDSFFDFDAEGWMKEWMDDMSFTGDRAYVLGGDYFIDLLRTISVLPFNVDLMNRNAPDLAPALFGEEATPGEDISPRFFDMVERGEWTWDLLGKLCEAIWEDSDGDGQDSIGDQLGILADTRISMTAGIYCYSNNERLFETKVIEDPNSKYYNKRWTYYPGSMDALGDIFDAVSSVYLGKGSLATDAPVEGDTPESPGLAYHWIKFGQGETLFAGACVLGALEDNAFQQMHDLYSVVPLPKVSVEQKYNSLIHDTGDAGAINVNVAPLKAKVISAYLQYCTEHSKNIRTEFLQTVTKFKTAVYNQGTDRMLELIYANIVGGRDKMIENVVGGDIKWHEELKKSGFTMTSGDFVSIYEANYPSKQNVLDDIIRKWYTYPKEGE